MSRLIVLLLFSFLVSFTAKENPFCSETRLFEKAAFPVGVAINTNKLKNDEKYRNIALAQFNSFTPEKLLKAQVIHPKKDEFNFWEVDHLMEYTKHYNIRLHGHTLIWHKALPEWIEKFKGDQGDWEALMKTHIQTVIRHCKGSVRSWDVVNEAFNEDGTLRNNIWLKNIGESYIQKAFQYAREADSSALLFYNDYTLEKNGLKLNAVLEFLGYLKSKGIKIDGIGMQMHINLNYPSIEEINGAAKKIQDNGYLVHYSELDISLSDHTFFTARKKILEQQRTRMKEIVKGFMKLDPKKRFGITLWGVSDNDSWLIEDSYRARPLLYNERYNIKPAYCGFLEGLKE
ncbi:MAG: Endo,4-beta-xylanase [Bacteroidetes bacterium]|jgi:endo-1,4-beta-xylanase|nr:Endo,4-beta-xylanase [Bacteroidota bacterium]